jgi:hypothetical protein
MVSGYKDRMQQRPISAVTYNNYGKALALLNKRLLSQGFEYFADTTIWSVNILAHVALWLVRHAEVSMHTSALRQIIEISGGQAFLLQRPTLRYQLYW